MPDVAKRRRCKGRIRTRQITERPLPAPPNWGGPVTIATSGARLWNIPRRPASHCLVTVARQWTDYGGLLDWEVRDDFDRILVDDQHLLDAHAVAEFLAVLGLQRKRHALPRSPQSDRATRCARLVADHIAQDRPRGATEARPAPALHEVFWTSTNGSNCIFHPSMQPIDWLTHHFRSCRVRGYRAQSAKSRRVACA